MQDFLTTYLVPAASQDQVVKPVTPSKLKKAKAKQGNNVV